jgi:hypothetical protein
MIDLSALDSQSKGFSIGNWQSEIDNDAKGNSRPL